MEYINAILGHVVPIISEASKSQFGLMSLIALIALAIVLCGLAILTASPSALLADEPDETYVGLWSCTTTCTFASVCTLPAGQCNCPFYWPYCRRTADPDSSGGRLYCDCYSNG